MIEVLAPGLLTTVQDGGRTGWARYGVPPSGPLDAAAHRAANTLVGNAPEAAALEITWTGPAIRFTRRALVAVCGADFELWAGGIPLPTWHTLFIRAGAVLRFGARRWGARAYLAVDGSFDLPPFIGSRSTYLPGGFGGHEGRALQAGDQLPLGPSLPNPASRAGQLWPRERRPSYAPEPVLRVILGPQDDHFTPQGQATFLSSAYTLAPTSNRMGARLAGPVIEHRSPDAAGIISDGVVMGSIQVPPNGQPVVMLADHQTTGGYPKIATLLRADLPLLAQLMPGETLRFCSVPPPGLPD